MKNDIPTLPDFRPVLEWKDWFAILLLLICLIACISLSVWLYQEPIEAGHIAAEAFFPALDSYIERHNFPMGG